MTTFLLSILLGIICLLFLAYDRTAKQWEKNFWLTLAILNLSAGTFGIILTMVL